MRFMDSLTDKVYQYIYEKILEGSLAPGERLQISMLSNQLEVALSPVREALSRLSTTGLVVAISQKGFSCTAQQRGDGRSLPHKNLCGKGRFRTLYGEGG